MIAQKKKPDPNTRKCDVCHGTDEVRGPYWCGFHFCAKCFCQWATDLGDLLCGSDEQSEAATRRWVDGKRRKTA